MIALYVALTAVFVSLGQVMWKLAMKALALRGIGGIDILPGAMGSLYFWLGGVSYIFGVLFWLLQLQKTDLSHAFSMTTGCVLVLTVLADVFLFGADLNAVKIISILLILTGVLVGQLL
jgi:multidrug transporter EmrE-like cation transporter